VRFSHTIYQLQNWKISMQEPEYDFSEEIVDLEQFAKEGKIPPARCKGYRIRIDKLTYVVTEPSKTGRELLELAEKQPERFSIRQKLKGGQVKKIELDERVDFTTVGIERFMTLPLDQQEGYTARHHFDLPENDREYLDSLGLVWETVLEKNVQRLVINNYPLLNGYNPTNVSLCLQMGASYPDEQIDMVFFCPAVIRADGKPIPATGGSLTFDGKTWQQWSRHRTSVNPWRADIDYIGTHMALVDHWLERELLKGKSE
jgi:hypothetical protein